jgi:hypothetical protein
MPQFPQRDLTNQFISTSYQDVVQRYASTGSNTYLLDGLGYVIVGIPNTSVGNNVVTQDVPASSSVSSSYANVSNTSITSSYSFFSEFSDTSSVSVFSQISSQAYTASYILGNEVDGNVNSSSYALSASWTNQPLSVSYSLTSSYAANGSGASISSSYSLTSSFASSASWAPVMSSDTSISSSWASSSVSSSYSLTSSNVPFNGNRSIKRSGYSGLNVGGFDVDTFLNNFFFPFISATVSVSGGGTFQTGSVQTISVVSSITINDETTFGTASVFRNGSLWNTTASIPPYSFTFIDTNISSSEAYQSFVQVNNNGSPTNISSNTTNVSFIFPYLWGTSTTSSLSGTALYNAFTSQIVNQGNKTINMNGSAVYIYFAYPDTYPVLTSILDPNLFQVISSFNESLVSVTSTGLANNWTTNYKVYQTQLVSSPNGNFQFIY